MPIAKKRMMKAAAVMGLSAKPITTATTISGEGFLNAEDVSVKFPDSDSGFDFTPGGEYEHFDLGPGRSYVIPFGARRNGGDLPCGLGMSADYHWRCGGEVQGSATGAGLFARSCISSGNFSGGPLIVDGDPEGGGGSFWDSGIGGWGATDCNVCLKDLLSVFTGCALPAILTAGEIPVIGCLVGMGQCLNTMSTGHMRSKDWLSCAVSLAGCATEVACPECKALGAVLSLAGCLITLSDLECTGSGGGRMRAVLQPACRYSWYLSLQMREGCRQLARRK